MKVQKIAVEVFYCLVKHIVAADKIKFKNIPFSAFKTFGLWLTKPQNNLSILQVFKQVLLCFISHREKQASAKAWSIWYFPHLICSATKKIKSQLLFENFQASISLCLPILLQKDWSHRFPEKLASDLSGCKVSYSTSFALLFTGIFVFFICFWDVLIPPTIINRQRKDIFLKFPYCPQLPIWSKRGKATGTLFCLHPSDTGWRLAQSALCWVPSHMGWRCKAGQEASWTILKDHRSGVLMTPSNPCSASKRGCWAWHSLVTLPFAHLCFVDDSINFLSGMSHFGERSTIFLKQPGEETLFPH